MPDHVQPTAEELAKQLEETTAKLDAPDPAPSEEAIEEAPVEEEVIPSEAVVEETPEVIVPAEEEEKKEPQTTEDRYKESTKEAQRLYRNNVKMNEAIKDANSLPDPTDEELKAEFPEWEDMSDVEKRLSTDVLINKRFRAHITEVSEEQRNVDQWVDRVGKFVEDPKNLITYPELEGKTDAFKAYADDKKLVGTDFGVLIGNFLYEQSKTKIKHTGKMLETGTGGDKKAAKPVDEKISLEESSKLMKTDFNKWKQLLREGKLQMDVK